MDDRWKAGYREAKAIRKDAVKMVEATVQLGGDIAKESEAEIEALKKEHEAKGNVAREEEYHFAVIP